MFPSSEHIWFIFVDFSKAESLQKHLKSFFFFSQCFCLNICEFLMTSWLMSALTVCVLYRDFVEQHYVSLKKSNPDFPILIRECSGVQARVWARYGESRVTKRAVSLHQQVQTCVPHQNQWRFSCFQCFN